MTSISAFAKKTLSKKLFSFATLALAVSLISGCSDTPADSTPPPTSKTLFGDSLTVGNGKAYSWLIKDGQGIPTSVGVTLKAAALENLPDTGIATSYMMKLPTDSLSPYDHISLDWNRHGHPPDSIYTIPHFDVHFYTIPMSERLTIMPGMDTTTVPAEYLPARFVTDGGVVPTMGAHYLSLDAHELHNKDFDHTFIYGFYKGKFIFHEPMLTLDHLKKNGSGSFPIAQPAKYEVAGKYYPTKYNISYNAQTMEYSIILHDFKKF